jgi:hypothetical protein
MAATDAASESQATDGEGGSGEPLNDDIRSGQQPPSIAPAPVNGPSAVRSHVALPPPEAGSFLKEPGYTRQALKKLTMPSAAGDHAQQVSGSSMGCTTPSTASSSSPPESEWTSPSTRPPSQAASRAPSMSESKAPAPPQPPLTKKKPENDVHANTAAITAANTAAATTTPAAAAGRPHKVPSITDSEKHKFNLKDLLGAGPKLARRSSARSTGSSRKSDSDGKSAGESVGSGFSQKYGVCQKVAIGKGATSVVRLAHKWDRSEERLYAVKVRGNSLNQTLSPQRSSFSRRSSAKDERTKQRRSMSRNSPPSSAYRRRCTTSTLSRPLTSFRMKTSTGAK